MADSEPINDRGGRESAQSREFALARLAGRQFGVVSREQLLALGFSAKEISGRGRRLLHPLYPGVYAVGHTRIVGHARLTGALLSCGPASFLSHRTAAAVHGLRQENAHRIEVTVRGARARVRQELIVHRTAHRPHPSEVVVRNGLRVSSVARLLIELALGERPTELDRLITQAIRKGILDLVVIEEALGRHPRRPGLNALKRVLRDYRPRQDRKSDLERAFDRLIKGTEIPSPLRNVIVDGWELDCYWPEKRLVVELDGRPYHVAVRDMERDKRKDAKLLRLGIAVVRITDLRLELEPEAVLADILALTT